CYLMKEELMATSGEAKVTTDHDEIRQWAEERGAEPSCVRGTGGEGDVGMLRLDFPGYTGEDTLEHISWDEWFEKFDERGLALLHQDQTASGEKSNFNKIVSRETAEQVESGTRPSGRAAKRAKKTSKVAKKAVNKGASKAGADRYAAAKKTTPKKSASKKATKKMAGKKAA